MRNSTLKYRSVIFRKNGESRFIATCVIGEGWNQVQEIPRLIDISSISLLDPNSTYNLLQKAFRDYEDTMTPSMPTAIEISQNQNNYHGLLVKKSPNCVSLITDEGLMEITSPYILRYTKCLQGQCEPIIPRVNLLFSNMPTNENIKFTGDMETELTFTSEGFSWDASYKAIFDFDSGLMSSLSCDISCSNKTELSLLGVEASFLSKSDEGNRYRHMPRAMMSQTTMAAPRFSSEQTVTGGAIYKLDTSVNIPERSTSSFNFVKFLNIPIVTIIRFNILERPKHPNTVVKFVIPEEMIDGIPTGNTECWDGKTWLSNSEIQMAAPKDSVTLYLGENAFINISTGVISNLMAEEVENDEDDISDGSVRVVGDHGGYAIRRSIYYVSVTVKNNSQRKVKVVPYHPNERKVKSLKVTQQIPAKSPVLINLVTPLDNSDDDLGNRIEFDIQELAPGEEFKFAYTAII